MSIGPGLGTLWTVLWTPVGPEIKRGLKILYSKAQWFPKTQIISQGILLTMQFSIMLSSFTRKPYFLFL